MRVRLTCDSRIRFGAGIQPGSYLPNCLDAIQPANQAAELDVGFEQAYFVTIIPFPYWLSLTHRSTETVLSNMSQFG